MPQSTTNVHDWVWLGRATIEKAATHTNVPANGSSNPSNNNNNNNSSGGSGSSNNEMRITENPFNSGGFNTRVDNLKYLDSSQTVVVDTATYCKNSGQHHAGGNGGSDFNDFCEL